MTLLEHSTKAKIENDKAIVDLEKKNLDLQELDTDKFTFGVGLVCLAFSL